MLLWSMGPAEWFSFGVSCRVSVRDLWPTYRSHIMSLLLHSSTQKMGQRTSLDSRGEDYTQGNEHQEASFLRTVWETGYHNGQNLMSKWEASPVCLQKLPSKKGPSHPLLFWSFVACQAGKQTRLRTDLYFTDMDTGAQWNGCIYY